MFEPLGSATHAPGFRVYPGSNIELPNSGFEHRVPEPVVRTLEFPNPGFEHRVPEPGVRTPTQGSNIEFPNPGFEHRVRTSG